MQNTNIIEENILKGKNQQNSQNPKSKRCVKKSSYFLNDNTITESVQPNSIISYTGTDYQNTRA